MRATPVLSVLAAALVALGALRDVPRAAAEGEAATPAPKKASEFTLKDVDGKEHKLSQYKDKWVVLEWTNLGCPFVKKHYAAPSQHMQGLQKRYVGKGVVWLTICSSAEGKQGYQTAEQWKATMKDNGMAPTAVLLDADGTVGKAYGAKTTPEIWVLNGKQEIVYHGAADDAPPPNADVTKANNYIVKVLDAVLDGKEPPVRETQPYGCSVKYAQ
jgi:peroxiredoxin